MLRASHIALRTHHDSFTSSGRCGDRLRQLTFLNLMHYWNRRHCAAGRTVRAWGTTAIYMMKSCTASVDNVPRLDCKRRHKQHILCTGALNVRGKRIRGMRKIVRGCQQHLKVEEATTTEKLRRVCAKGSAACTTINMVFMIDVYIQAYDYLLSH